MLDAETVPFIDVTAATMLAALAADLARDGVVLVLGARGRPGARRAGAAEGSGPLIGMYPSVHEAVDAVARK